ncbi:Mur ligase family protein [Vibrio sp. SG41-7]|uniref:Mur ligase family protein n=1 Tax=Vibrio sp. SG41-7 TaxID=2760973 RepID=UPI001C71A11F|nr:Mur ligase family protein [Vibrio sp. SG41-7]
MPKIKMKNPIIKLTLDDCRRLTGKNLLWEKSGSILDAFVDGIDKKQVIEQWGIYAKQLLEAVGWSAESTIYREFEGGVSLAISAPIDALYAACELNEAAWDLTCAHFIPDILMHNGVGGEGVIDVEIMIATIKQSIAQEVNPELLHLIELAKKHQVPYLVDDDDVSLGYGKYSKTWLTDNLPEPKSIVWQEHQSLPVAMVTGTNGKSTSVRIMSQIIKAAGSCCGVTSTDFIRVGEDIIDYGDYSGPGGARMLLRHPDTEFAVLEVARGGMLRRGLPVDNVDAALITNVAEDHLGQYGINTVEALAKVKAIVAKGLKSGTLVLNADDPYLVELAPSFMVEKCWFSLNENNTVLQKHRANKGAICFPRGDKLIYSDSLQNETTLVDVNDIPMTLNGAAKHNIQNALGAIGLAKSLGIEDTAITRALVCFSSDVNDNPGRGNQFVINDAKVIMDFAHNVHSMDAMVSTTEHMPAERKFLMLSYAGDRSDADIINMTISALKMKADILVIAEISDYLRGRLFGEVPGIIASTAESNGMPAENIIFSSDPVAGSKYIIERLQPNDLALLMVLSQRDEVVELLQAT